MQNLLWLNNALYLKPKGTIFCSQFESYVWTDEHNRHTFVR